jgi:hypothetical protein
LPIQSKVSSVNTKSFLCLKCIKYDDKNPQNLKNLALEQLNFKYANDKLSLSKKCLS